MDKKIVCRDYEDASTFLIKAADAYEMAKKEQGAIGVSLNDTYVQAVTILSEMATELALGNLEGLPKGFAQDVKRTIECLKGRFNSLRFDVDDEKEEGKTND